MVRQMRVSFPLGAISAIVLYILTILYDVWSRINTIAQILLAIVLIILFCADFELSKSDKS